MRALQALLHTVSIQPQITRVLNNSKSAVSQRLLNSLLPELSEQEHHYRRPCFLTYFRAASAISPKSDEQARDCSPEWQTCETTTCTTWRAKGGRINNIDSTSNILAKKNICVPRAVKVSLPEEAPAQNWKIQASAESPKAIVHCATGWDIQWVMSHSTKARTYISAAAQPAASNVKYS